MDNRELSSWRADVIERFINIETLIDSIICQHYFNKMPKNFYFEVLYDEYFSFALKRRILVKVITDIDENKINDLNRLNNIRNYFAHYNQEIIKITEDFNEKGIIMDPRNIEKEIDFEKLHDEFTSKSNGVEEYLFKVFQDMGGIARDK